MYLTKVELHNYGIYRGTHTMELTDRVGPRNITLVGGMNGRGKTTLHDAILLALYGKLAHRYIQENTRSYERLLSDRVNRHAEDGLTYVSVSLVLDDGTLLRVVRSWTVKDGNRVESSVTVEKNGIEDKYLGENWAYYIEELLPFGIARLFFFNNERITQLADDASLEQIKSSIRSAIGVTTVEKAAGHLEEVIRRKEKDLQAFENSEENRGLQESAAQLAALEDRRAECETQLAASQRHYEAVSAQLEAGEKAFWSAGGPGQDQETIKKEKQRVSDSVKTLKGEMLRLASDPATPLYLCRDLVLETYSREKERQDSNAQRAAEHFLRSVHDRLLERLQSSGLSKKAKDIAASILREELLGDETAESGTDDAGLTAAGMLLLERTITDAFQALLPALDPLISQIEAQESELRDLDVQLGAADSRAAAMERYEDLKKLEKERNEAGHDCRRLREQLDSLGRQIEAVKAERNRLFKVIAEKENANNDNARIIRYAAMSADVLAEFRLRLQREKVARLSGAATRCFQILVEKASLVSGIKIDPDTLDVTILDREGRVLPQHQLSAGEQQMFAISVVWALALTSGYQAPVIIDTPLARLDSSHRAGFVTKYLPAAGPQVIVLSTDAEISGRYLDLIRENVVKYYLLRYHEEDQCTDIVEGYFGQEGE